MNCRRAVPYWNLLVLALAIVTLPCAGVAQQEAATPPANGATPQKRPPAASDIGAPVPTRLDILRGEYGPYRANNHLLSYHLTVRVDPERKFISGKNTIRFQMFATP